MQQAEGRPLWDAAWSAAGHPIGSKLLDKIDLNSSDCAISAHCERAAVAAILNKPPTNLSAAQASFQAEGRQLVHWAVFADKASLVKRLVDLDPDVCKELVHWAAEWSHISTAVHQCLIGTEAAAASSRAIQLHNTNWLQAAAAKGVEGADGQPAAEGWDASFAASLSSTCSSPAQVMRYVEV